MSKMISERGNFVCRVCKNDKLENIIDLGEQPLPSEYGKTPNEKMEAFPLHLKICPNCGLGQVGEYVLPERIFTIIIHIYLRLAQHG